MFIFILLQCFTIYVFLLLKIRNPALQLATQDQEHESVPSTEVQVTISSNLKIRNTYVLNF